MLCINKLSNHRIIFHTPPSLTSRQKLIISPRPQKSEFVKHALEQIRFHSEAIRI